MNFKKLMEKATILVKELAVKEIVNNLDSKEFYKEVKKNEQEIFLLKEDCSEDNNITNYIYIDETTDITISVYEVDALISIEYNDLNNNIHFMIEKFLK